MGSHEALAAALGMLRYPHLVRQARRSPLPKGVTFLLEVAAGEPVALREAEAFTGRPEAVLRKAAGFFIEQVLFNGEGDTYRTLGASCEASNADLRRHMALIMKWLHPDLFFGGDGFDRSLYVSRVTEAWDAIKTDERRAAYDAFLAERPLRADGFDPSRAHGQILNLPQLGQRPVIARNGGQTHLSAQRRKAEPFWSRVFFLLGSRR